MRNRWLQWIKNVQKPLAGLFLHLVWPKPELESLHGSFSQFFVVSAHQNTPRKIEPNLCVFSIPKTQHPHAYQKNWHFVAPLAPPREEVMVVWLGIDLFSCSSVGKPLQCFCAFGGHK
jgi:hypothetical protein